MKVIWSPLARDQVVQAFATIAVISPATNWKVEPQAREPGGPESLALGDDLRDHPADRLRHAQRPNPLHLVADGLLSHPQVYRTLRVQPEVGTVAEQTRQA